MYCLGELHTNIQSRSLEGRCLPLLFFGCPSHSQDVQASVAVTQRSFSLFSRFGPLELCADVSSSRFCTSRSHRSRPRSRSSFFPLNFPRRVRTYRRIALFTLVRFPLPLFLTEIVRRRLAPRRHRGLRLCRRGRLPPRLRPPLPRTLHYTLRDPRLSQSLFLFRCSDADRLQSLRRPLPCHLPWKQRRRLGPRHARSWAAGRGIEGAWEGRGTGGSDRMGRE